MVANSSLPTLISQRGDSRLNKVRIKIMPAKIMCRIVASIHCLELLSEMWRDVPQLAWTMSVSECLQSCRPTYEISKHDSQVDRATENTNAETTNTSRRNLSQVSWSNNSSLSDSKTHDKSSSENLSIASCRSDINDNTNDPDNTKLASSPDTTL